MLSESTLAAVLEVHIMPAYLLQPEPDIMAGSNKLRFWQRIQIHAIHKVVEQSPRIFRNIFRCTVVKDVNWSIQSTQTLSFVLQNSGIESISQL